MKRFVLLLALVLHSIYVDAQHVDFMPCFLAEDPDPDCGPCNVCSTIPIGPIPDFSGSSTQHHELRINIGKIDVENYIISSSTECYSTKDSTDVEITCHYENGEFALLEGLQESGSVFWFIPSNQSYMKKTNLPLRMDNTNFCSRTSLCQTSTTFHVIGESSSSGHNIARGGVYRLSFPQFTSAKPLYFYLPVTNGMWYSQGPDAEVFYGFVDHEDDERCAEGELYNEYAFTTINEFLDVGSQTYPSISNVQSVLFSTDYAELSSFWYDNVITLGFSTSIGGPLSVPILEFEAENPASQTGCLSSLPSGTSLVKSLSVNSNEEFEWNWLLSGLHPSYMYDYWVEVKAEFKNGESIDCIKKISDLLNPNFSTSYGAMVANIRGDIEDYANAGQHFYINLYTKNKPPKSINANFICTQVSSDEYLVVQVDSDQGNSPELNYVIYNTTGLLILKGSTKNGVISLESVSTGLYKIVVSADQLYEVFDIYHQ